MRSFTAFLNVAYGEIPLSRPDAHVAEQEQDLYQLAASLVTQTRACSAEIVWGHAGHRAFRTRVLHHSPDDFRAKPVRGDFARFVYRPKYCSERRFAAVIHDCKPEATHAGIGIVRT